MGWKHCTNMLLLAIYLGLQLTHSESTLSQFMPLCGQSFFIALFGTHHCPPSWISLRVSVSTLTDLPAMSSRSALLRSLSNSCSSSEPSITHLHGTTLPCKAVFSVLHFGFGHGACSWGDLLSLFYLCRSSYGSCYSHILPCSLFYFSLLCSPSGIHSIWLYHLSEHFSFACPPLKKQGFAVLLWFCRATICVSTCHSCIFVWKQCFNGHTETVKNLWMTLWLCLLSGNWTMPVPVLWPWVQLSLRGHT